MYNIYNILCARYIYARVNAEIAREKMSLDELHNAMFIINIYIYEIAYLIGLCEITPHT